jgi:hypothetical protein
MPYGTLQIDDAFMSNDQTVLAFGEQKLLDTLVVPSLLRHEAWSQEMGSLFCERTTDFLRSYGEVGDVENEEMGEQSRPDASKAPVSTVNIGFQLRRWGSSVQWTRDALRVISVNEFARQMDSHANMDRRRILQQIKSAIFTPTNNLTYKDSLPSRRTKNLVLPVRAFYNADGADIPDGPNGEQFDGATHTHYLGRAGGALAASDVKAVINTVLEHDPEGRIVLEIALGNEDQIRAMTGPGEFSPYVDSRIVQPQTATYAGGQSLDVRNSGDRAIGIFGPAEVWVKPWEPYNYLFAVDINGGKPLAWRTPEDDPTLGVFDIRAEDERYPLRARTMARDFGISVARRGKGAVLYAGGTSYVKPDAALVL